MYVYIYTHRFLFIYTNIHRIGYTYALPEKTSDSPRPQAPGVPTAAALRPLRAAGPMSDGSWTDLDGLHMSSFKFGIKCPTYPDNMSDLTGCVGNEIVIRMMMIMMVMVMTMT
jgi:hypothetical protein